MGADLCIRPATGHDVDGILGLVRASLGDQVPFDREYWTWKHQANPFGPSPCLLAESDGRLAGLRAFMRWRWRAGGTEASAVRAVDTATHPDFRGQGIFNRLTLQLRDEMAREGAALVFNTPNAQSRPGYLKMGWTLVGRSTLWVRPVRPLRFLRALRRERLGGAEGEPPPVEAAPAGDVLRQPGVQRLVEAAVRPSGRRLHTPVTARYLQWRYADVPGFRYHALSRGEGEDGALTLVRSRRRGALREIRICDVVVGPSRAARTNLRALLRQVSRAADVDVVLGIAAGRPALQRALLATGFVPVPRAGPILTVYPFPTSDLPDPRRLSSWAATIGDLELF